jgi:hypothetical protein
MSDSSSSSSFTKLVPGFDFLQGLVKSAGAALPGIGQWVAPTIDPDELEKRIEELRTVQFWLEQNARTLGATIQALEVQRMTLSTLKTMNVPLADLRDVLKTPTAMGNAAAAAAASNFPNLMAGATAPAQKIKAASPARKSAAKTPAAKTGKAAAAATAGTPATAVDPMQWWSALSQQFTQIATQAMKDSAADTAKNIAGALVKGGVDAAGETLRKAAGVPGAMVDAAARTVVGAGTAAARTAVNAKNRSTGRATARRR